VDDENPFDRIMKATRAKIQESEEEQCIQAICNAIGERRIRDLYDLISEVEFKSGWSAVPEFLAKASSREYPVPAGFQKAKLQLEPLKFREIVFSLFGCPGLEPASVNISSILEQCFEAESFIDASHLIKEVVELKSYEQIESGDTLFFETGHAEPDMSQLLATKIDAAQRESLSNVTLKSHGALIDINELWHSEYGRIALADIGVLGTTAPYDIVEQVVSVIQVSPEQKTRLLEMPKSETQESMVLQPSQPQYRELLTSVIKQDINTLTLLGSRHACPTLTHILRGATDSYVSADNSLSYQKLTLSIRDHIAIRYTDSILPLAELADSHDTRLAAIAIKALSNFYHESAVSSLLDSFCRRKSKSIRKSILEGIAQIKDRCPETKSVVRDAIESRCMYYSELERFYKRIWRS
jgi:hypothetical protein